MVRRKLFLAAVCAMSTSIIGCDLAPPPPFDPRLIQQPERDRSSEVVVEPLQALPTTREAGVGNTHSQANSDDETRARRPTTGPDLDSDPIVRMSLHEIIHRALINNHDIKVAGYQPAIEGTRVIEASANFDPAFFANTQYQQKHELNGGNIFNSFTGGPLVVTNVQSSDVGQAQTGLQENLPAGGQVQLQYESTYSWFKPQQTLNNPFYQNDLTLSVTQPLLKNFGYDVNHAQIVIDRINQRVSLLEFRKSVEQNASDIEKAYWQLVQAERDIRIQEQLVRQTETTYSVLSTRQKKKLDVSPLQVAQAETQLQARRTQLIQFKSHARDLSDQIKGLMSDPEYPVTSSIIILPLDEPVDEPLEFALQDQIETALENRLELGEQQLKVDAATVTITVAKNNLLPQFDFVGSVGPEGASGDLGPAIKSSLDFSHVDFTVGFKLLIPLGNRSPRAIWKRSILQRMQAIEQYRAYVEQVSVDVKISARAVATAWDANYSSRLARYAAEDALRDINARERANEPLTPEFVQLKLQIQDELASALQNEAEAVANYNIAIAQLERSKGTLLRYNNVMLQEAAPTKEEDGLAN